MFYSKTKNTLTTFENVLFQNHWAILIVNKFGTKHPGSRGFKILKNKESITSNIMIFSQMFLLIEAFS